MNPIYSFKKRSSAMKKFLSIALCLVLVLSCVSVFAAADDDAVKVRVYKINPEHYYEGCICIYTPERGETLGSEGQSFAWWAVVVFEEDAASGGYKCTATYPLGGDAKGDVAIPANGFILAGNTGNDWPALFEGATGSEWYYNDTNEQGIPYSECPNYATDHVKEDLEVIASIKVGDIMYLDGVDLGSENLNTNEDEETIFYYSDNYESFAYVSTEKPAPVVDEPSVEPSEEPSVEPSEEPSAAPSGDTVKETITIDGKIDDLGWTSSNANWITLSKWFVDEDFDVKGETVKYAVRSDADNVYIAIEIGHNWSDIAADSDLSTTAGLDAAVTTGTRVRLWIGGGADGAPAGFFDILRHNGEVKTLYRKVETTEISAAINGKILEICLPKTGHEQFTIGEKAKLNVNFSDIIYGEEGNKYAQINAFEEEQNANWKTDANYPEFDMAAIALGEVAKGNEKPVPSTSDNGIIALAVIASLAVAGAVIVKKSR